MGEARQVFDRFTAAMTRGDIDEVASLYVEDATALSPEGELGGRKDIVEFLRPFTEAFSDFRWEPLHSHEDGNTALDEGWICGVHTSPIPGPDGQPVPATGKSIRVRECDPPLLLRPGGSAEATWAHAGLKPRESRGTRPRSVVLSLDRRDSRLGAVYGRSL
jgi:ketosteroid isomerase-like protein